MYKNIIFIALSLVVFAACKNDPPVPKPRAYPKINYPTEVAYSDFDTNFCSFTFRMPSYMHFERDSTFFDGKAKDPCWFNLEIPCFNGTIHFTYVPVHSKAEIHQVFEDSYRMAAEHDKKADANEPYLFENKQEHVYGVLYDISGFVASPFQFIVTDSLHHTVRGSLYFNVKPNPDSLAPMIAFVKKDMMNMLNTLRWTK